MRALKVIVLIAGTLAALTVIGFGIYFVNYNSESAQDGRALAAFQATPDGMRASAQAQATTDSIFAAGVRVAHRYGEIAGCRHIKHIEASDPNGPVDISGDPKSAATLHLIALAGQARANAVLITTPPSWPGAARGEAYACPDSAGRERTVASPHE